MLDRLEPGDSVTFVISDGESALLIEGTVEGRYNGSYIRVNVESPQDQRDLDIVHTDAPSDPIKAYTQYDWEFLGFVPMLTLSTGGYETVIRAH